jgi:tripartite-type tricarboxylate transporter receptor subunit TctC
VVAGPLVNAGKLKAYGRKRFAGLPDLPTMGELGYKKLDIDFWHMLLAPAGTPRPIVDKPNSALRAALADAKVDKTFADVRAKKPDGSHSIVLRNSLNRDHWSSVEQLGETHLCCKTGPPL